MNTLPSSRYPQALDLGPAIFSLFWDYREAREAWWELCPPRSRARHNPTLCGKPRPTAPPKEAPPKPAPARQSKPRPSRAQDRPLSVDVVCGCCNALFQATGPARFQTLYCSDKCKWAMRRGRVALEKGVMPLTQKSCVECGAEFMQVRHHQKCCSAECGKRHDMKNQKARKEAKKREQQQQQ